MKGKKILWKLFWGFGFVLAATFLIVDALGLISPIESFMGEVSIWTLLLSLLMLAFTVSGLIKGKIASIFIPLSVIFMLFEKNIATIAGLENTNIINNWIVLASAILLTTGVSILIPSKKKEKIKKKFKKKVKNGIEIEIETNANEAENNFGSSMVYVDCTDFTPSRIENNLGACTIQFQNIENYVGGKTIHIENNLGPITIQVPSDWVVKASIENNLGSITVPDCEDKDGPILYISGENSLGVITVTYI